MRGARKRSLRDRWDAWVRTHENAASVLVGAAVALSLVTLFLFVTFSDFSGSAEFIYNQF